MSLREQERRIANALRAAALTYPECPAVQHGHTRCGWHCGEAVTIVVIDGLTIRCRPYKNHIEDVAAKYERGFSRSSVNRRLFKLPARRALPQWSDADERHFRLMSHGTPTILD